MDDTSHVEKLLDGRWIAQGHVLIWYSQSGHVVSSLVGIGEDIRKPRDVVWPRLNPCPMHRGHVLPAKTHSRIILSRVTVSRALTTPACPASSERPARRFLLRGYRYRS